jgi:hypothetical protein
MIHIYVTCDIIVSTLKSVESDERWSIILYLVSNKNTDLQFYMYLFLWLNFI